MKIMLVRPPQQKSAVFHILPPLGLGYLAASVKHLRADVQIVDCVNKNMDAGRLCDFITRAKPQVIGFTVYSHDLESVRSISSYVKGHISKNIYILVGGPHPSAAPEHTFDYLRHVDFGFAGEAEKGFAALAELLLKRQEDPGHDDPKSLSRIPGLIYRDDRGSLKINPQCHADPLDALGFPDWDLIDPRDYLKTCHGVFYKKRSFAPIFTSRGCPQKCSFCAAHPIMGRKIRRRSVAHVLKEMEGLKKRFGIEEFHILDDNFTADKDYVMAFCKALLDSRLGVCWSCPNGIRIDSIDKEMLDAMKRSGCYSVFVGIESGSQRVLDSMNKNLSVPRIEEAARLIKSKGFKVTGFFILGYPGETAEEMLRTIEFSKRLPLDAADFSNFIPLPGSSVFKQLFKDEGVCRDDFPFFSSPANIIGYSDRLPEGGLRKSMIRKAYLGFYLRPRILAGLIARLRSPYQVYFILKRLFEYLNPRYFPVQGSSHV